MFPYHYGIRTPVIPDKMRMFASDRNHFWVIEIVTHYGEWVPINNREGNIVWIMKPVEDKQSYTIYSLVITL